MSMQHDRAFPNFGRVYENVNRMHQGRWLQRGEQLANPTPSLKLCLSYSFLWDRMKPGINDSSKSGSRHQLVESMMKACPDIRNVVEHTHVMTQWSVTWHHACSQKVVLLKM